MMSQKWAFTGINYIVQSARQNYTLDIQGEHFIISHNNLNIPFRVYEPTAVEPHNKEARALGLFRYSYGHL